jgi:putative cardiolipin synthase
MKGVDPTMKHARIIYLLFFAALFLPGSLLPEPRGTDEKNFPRSGIRSIFRDDYKFFHSDGEASEVSIPPTRLGCGVKLLNRGEESFEWRIRMLKRSRESIRIQTYIFTCDEIGKKVADRLKRKRRHGLDVKLIVDAYTKFSPADRRMYADIELKGVAVMGFEPMYLLGVADERVLNVDDVNKRFHEKYWVIDDKVAFIGGTNIANEYARYGDDPNDKWRDQDALLTGPIVRDVAAAFDENYEYFLQRRESRLPTMKWSTVAKIWWKISGLAPPPIGSERISGLLPRAQLDAEDVPVRFIRHRPRHDEDYVYQAHLHLIRNARQSILIENAYFVPNRALMNSFVEAAGRGVEMTIITNSDVTNDVEGMQPLSRYFYKPLIEAGINVYEWQGDHPGHGSLHSKLMVVDGQVTVIGSFNLDPRSIYLNSENVVLIDSPGIAAQLAGFVESHDLPVCEKVSMVQAEEWHNPTKVSDQFKLLFGTALEEWY